MASVIAGGLAPLIASAVLVHYGNSITISIYIIICAAVSMTSLMVLPKAMAPLHVEAEVAVAVGGAV